MVVVVVFVTLFPLGAFAKQKSSGDILLPKGVISEPLGMGSFGVVWAAHCESQVSGKGKGQHVFFVFSGEDSVIFSQRKHFPPKKQTLPKKSCFWGVDCFFVEVFFWFGKVKILGRLASHSTVMMLSSSLLLQLLDDIILTSELFFFEKYCKSF